MMNVRYKQEMAVPSHIFDAMEELCEKADCGAKKCGTEFDRGVRFTNGYVGCIQVCGPCDPSFESCWTQMVLYDKDGEELCCSEPGESFGGEYCLDYAGDEYVVDVVQQHTTQKTQRSFSVVLHVSLVEEIDLEDDTKWRPIVQAIIDGQTCDKIDQIEFHELID